jgi:hypothetical protein
MGFTKLDSRILQSSIMAEDPFTFKIWITLLAACGPDGIAECSAMFLESICRIPIDQVKKSLEKLMSRDENSRSINDEGRRVERVNGGYKIINYLKYRDMSLKSAEAERKRLYRDNKKCPDTSGRCPDSSASMSAYISSSVVLKEESEEKELLFDNFRKLYPGTKLGNKTEFENFKKKNSDWKSVLLELLPALLNQKQWRNEMTVANMFVPEWKNLKTWINQRCWEMEKPEIENKQVNNKPGRALFEYEKGLEGKYDGI